MFGIPIATIHTWAEVFAAVGTTLTAAFLAWDRIAPRPVLLSGYVTLAVERGGVAMDVFLDRQDQDTVIITTVRATPCFALAWPDERTPAAAVKELHQPSWFKAASMDVKVERDHLPSTPVLRLLIRERPANLRRLPMFLARKDVQISGVLPYRGRRKFRLLVTPPDGDLVTAVRLMEKQRARNTRQPAQR